MSHFDVSRWERLGSQFEEEVFNVHECDGQDVLQGAIDRVARKTKTVADLGCGTGRLLPALAPRFKKVHAVDGAQSLLVQAEERCTEFSNITYLKADLARRVALENPVDVAVSVNVLLTIDKKRRDGMFRVLRSCLKKNGVLLLVVPSMESALLTERVLSEWHRRSRAKGPHDPESMAADKSTKAQILRGEFITGGVPTQHYLREELETLVENAGFSCERTLKVQYEWQSVFPKPPRWLRAPRPWDWLVECRLG